MTLEEKIELMRQRGYTVNFKYRVNDGMNGVGMCKLFNDGINIHADFTNSDDSVKLIGMFGLFNISSNDISINHSRFKELFEDKLHEMLKRLNYI